jgi:hypothetical protein
MTRDEAQPRAAALTAAGSDYPWFARKGTDGWELVKVALPRSVGLDTLSRRFRRRRGRRPLARRPRTTGISTALAGFDHSSRVTARS